MFGHDLCRIQRSNFHFVPDFAGTLENYIYHYQANKPLKSENNDTFKHFCFGRWVQARLD